MTITEAPNHVKDGGRIWQGPDLNNVEELMSKWNSIGHYLFHQLNGEFANTILFTDFASKRRWTGSQLRDKILNVACALVDKFNFRPNNVVCISYDNSDYVLILAIAIISAGGIVACSYPKDPYAELLYLARKVEPKFLFCHEKNTAWAKQLEQDLGYHIECISMDSSASTSTGNIANFHQDLLHYDHKRSEVRDKIPFACKDLRKQVALITMSSGTSGKPKAVAQTHWNTLADLVCNLHSSRPGFNFACCSSLDYVSGRLILFGAIQSGYQAIILDGFEPSTYLSAIQEYKVQVIYIGAAAFYNLITYPRLDEFDISSVKCAFPMGAKIIYLDELKRFLERHPHISVLRQGYGTSEFGGGAMNTMTPEEYLVNCDNCGRLFPGMRAKIVDPLTGRLLGPNERGILHMRGETVFPGYYDKGLMRARQLANNKPPPPPPPGVQAKLFVDNNLNETAANKPGGGCNGDDDDDDDNCSPFVRDKSVFDEDGFYITGDYAYFSDKEELFIIGRQNEMMHCRGAKKVLPQELELIIEQHPAVDKVCVLGIPNKRELTLHCPRAFVVAKAKYYATDGNDDAKLELGLRLSTMNDELDEDLQDEQLVYSGASGGEPKLCRMKRQRRHLIVEDLMRFVNERAGWEKQLTGGIVLLDDIPTSRATGKFDKNYLRSLSANEIEIYGDRSS